jgi:hypothetical protein
MKVLLYQVNNKMLKFCLLIGTRSLILSISGQYVVRWQLGHWKEVV